MAESSLAVQDEDFEYPVGLNDFRLNCGNPGDSADIVFYFDRLYDTSTWGFNKYDTNGNVYSDLSDIVTFSVADVNGRAVTTASYTIADGDSNDADGEVNGAISDPAGPAVALLIEVEQPVEGLSETGAVDVLLASAIGVLILSTAYTSNRLSDRRS